MLYTSRYAFLRKIWVVVAMHSVMLWGCAETSPTSEPSQPASTNASESLQTFQSKLECRPGEVSEQTAAIVQALEPHCADCHNTGSRGYFKSVDAFQQLIVNNPNMIVPGDPDASEFVRLLKGEGTGAFTQMPIGVQTYEDMVQAGTAQLGVDEIEAWVRALQQGDMSSSSAPDTKATRVRRLRANEIERALYTSLGLDETDFFNEELSHANGVDTLIRRSDKLYPLRSPDALPASYYGEPSDRYLSLGGFSVIHQTVDDTSYAPAALLTLNQVSQAWCRLAIKKQGNTTLFGAQASVPSSESDVKSIISRWSLHFLGERFDEDQIEELYQNLYVTVVMEEDQEAALTGVCSYFIRHPKWIIL